MNEDLSLSEQIQRKIFQEAKTIKQEILPVVEKKSFIIILSPQGDKNQGK
jgi:hypothetical protein